MYVLTLQYMPQISNVCVHETPNGNNNSAVTKGLRHSTFLYALVGANVSRACISKAVCNLTVQGGSCALQTC